MAAEGKVGAREPKPVKVGVGVGALVVSKVNGVSHILLGKRKGSHGEGTWALPGGWLEKGEEFEQCARRELEEETGLGDGVLQDTATVVPHVSNNLMGSTHSVTVFVLILCCHDKQMPDAENREPHKCEKWVWHPLLDDFPSPTFAPLAELSTSKWWQDFVVRESSLITRVLALVGLR